MLLIHYYCLLVANSYVTGLLPCHCLIFMFCFVQGGASSRATIDDCNMFRVIKNALEVCDLDSQKQQVGLEFHR